VLGVGGATPVVDFRATKLEPWNVTTSPALYDVDDLKAPRVLQLDHDRAASVDRHRSPLARSITRSAPDDLLRHAEIVLPSGMAAIAMPPPRMVAAQSAPPMNQAGRRSRCRRPSLCV
jgi:hypothetical protein